MKKKLTILLLLIGLILTGYFLRQSWFVRYEVIELPVLEGYKKSAASKINNNGFILGTCLLPDSKLVRGKFTPIRRVFWDRELRIDPIPSPGRIQALNEFNQIVGTRSQNRNTHQAFVFDTTSGLQPIDIPDVTQTWGCDINNHGLVLVYGSALLPGNATTEVTIGWDIASATEKFRIASRSSQDSLNINNKNQVAGVSLTGTVKRGNPFIRDPESGYSIYTDLTIGSDVLFNDNGSMVFDSYDFKQPVLFHEGEPTAISQLPDGSSLLLKAINNHNQVVGHSHMADPIMRIQNLPIRNRWLDKLALWYLSRNHVGSMTHAILWEDGNTHDLNDLIPSDSGWFLEAANDINDEGEIVGVGYNPEGEERGFLLRPLD